MTKRLAFLFLILNILFISQASSFEYDSTKQTKCIEGMQTCESGNSELWICNSDGSYNVTKCDYGCYDYGNNSLECKSAESNSDDSYLGNIWIVILIVLLVILSVWFILSKRKR